jgi:hypothetical protein
MAVEGGRPPLSIDPETWTALAPSAASFVAASISAAVLVEMLLLEAELPQAVNAAATSRSPDSAAAGCESP